MSLENIKDRNLALTQAYQLFAQLFASAPPIALYKDVLSLTELKAPQLPPILTENPDEAAAAHYYIFNLETLPYESLFSEESLSTGGPRTLLLQNEYQKYGFDVRRYKMAADHLSTQLRFLSHLSGLTAHAAEQSAPFEQHQLEEATQHFLQNHFLLWVPAYCQSLNPRNAERQYQQAFVFFQELTLFILQIAQEHGESLTDGSMSVPSHAKTKPCILDTPECGINDIARYFATPSLCGVFLRRSDIQEIGRALDLPSGFGPRIDMLTMLFTCAAEYNSFEPLLRGMEHQIREAQHFHTKESTSELWANDCAETIERIEALSSQARELAQPPRSKAQTNTSSINA